jgi:hypothetical protein
LFFFPSDNRRGGRNGWLWGRSGRGGGAGGARPAEGEPGARAQPRAHAQQTQTHARAARSWPRPPRPPHPLTQPPHPHPPTHRPPPQLERHRRRRRDRPGSRAVVADWIADAVSQVSLARDGFLFKGPRGRRGARGERVFWFYFWTVADRSRAARERDGMRVGLGVYFGGKGPRAPDAPRA